MFGLEHGQSWLAGRVAGVPIRLHWTLGLMVVIQLVQALVYNPSYLVWAILIEVLIIGSIAFHELAHALVARGYGLRSLDITLHAFGGWARMAGEPTNTQQVAISAAGPVSNLVLWAAFAALTRSPGLGTLGWVAANVAQFNFVIALFNMVPAYPLDGGSVLLHGLRSIAPYHHANWLAYKVGVIISIPLGIFGLISNQLLLALVFWMSYQHSSERLIGVGHVGGWEYWKQRWSKVFSGRPRGAKITPINVNWQKYAPPGTTVRDPEDKPPTVN